MLIVNADHLHLAGIASLEEPCPYCSKTLDAYPLIMSDDAKQTVYHITCALELATDIIVDVGTFFRPPPPYTRLFTLTVDCPKGGDDAIDRS
jgi:hypothetical protein